MLKDLIWKHIPIQNVNEKFNYNQCGINYLKVEVHIKSIHQPLRNAKFKCKICKKKEII